jgi:hypothetical protein
LRLRQAAVNADREVWGHAVRDVEPERRTRREAGIEGRIAQVADRNSEADGQRERRRLRVRGRGDDEHE